MRGVLLTLFIGVYLFGFGGMYYYNDQPVLSESFETLMRIGGLLLIVWYFKFGGGE